MTALCYREGWHSAHGLGSPAIRALVEQVIVDEQTIIIKVRREPLLDRPMSSASDAPSDGAIELTAAVSIKRAVSGPGLF